MDLQSWLSKAPKYTTFRINKLKHFDSNTLKNFLVAQSKELNSQQIPKYYFIRPDCLVLEQWPEDIALEQTGMEVVVDALCAAAVLRGAHVFAPGILGLPANCQLDERVAIYGDLEGHCKRGLKVKYEGKKLFVGTGYLKKLRYDLFDNGVQPRGSSPSEPALDSMWVGSGGPTKQIYLRHVCFSGEQDHTFSRNVSRSRVTCVNAFAFDSTKLYSAESSGINSGPPFPINSFDKVLLDAPCSGLGQRPQLHNKMTPKMIHTCTVTDEENEGMVVWALDKFPCLRLIPAEPLLGGPGLADKGLSDEQRLMVQRFGPTIDSLRPSEEIYRDSIGFFIAAFTKIPAPLATLTH
ncbi:putative methyltransferase NSUN6 [Operophtera brumata]|uniref:Putative methyltransferase NSUN6 n=1 Tax=Operophtera brumata TaxID=104452 RepID=A0A0L7LUU4_OPEBR|nr:putative methyltransferase NSUN6 [Operophtera brumata]